MKQFASNLDSPSKKWKEMPKKGVAVTIKNDKSATVLISLARIRLDGSEGTKSTRAKGARKIKERKTKAVGKILNTFTVCIEQKSKLFIFKIKKYNRNERVFSSLWKTIAFFEGSLVLNVFFLSAPDLLKLFSIYLQKEVFFNYGSKCELRCKDEWFAKCLTNGFYIG